MKGMVTFLLLFGLLFPGLVLGAQPGSTDSELSKTLVGRWECRDNTGNSVFEFNADGIWWEEGTYAFDDGPHKVILQGKWYVKDGYLYELVKKTNLTGYFPVGEWIRVRVQAEPGGEVVMRPTGGVINRHNLAMN